MLKMDLEYVHGILFVRLKGRLTRKNHYKITNYLTPVLIKHKIKYLIYNLEYLESVDEQGIDAILSTKCAIKNNKGKIYLCCANKNISFYLRRLHVKITSSEKTALKMIEV